MTTFNVLLAVASLLAGAIAAVTGFGIGSLLTPVLALKVGTKLAHDCRSPSFDAWSP